MKLALILVAAWILLLPVLGIVTGLVLRARRRALPKVDEAPVQAPADRAPQTLAEVA